MKFTMRGIITFILVGFGCAFAASIFVSKLLSASITNNIAENEIEFVFGAIEAGPLTIARLQDSAIAQKGLAELMTNPALKHRNFLSAKILGGVDFAFEYSVWNSNAIFSNHCVKKYEKVYRYPDSLNPFRITIERDSCLDLPEARAVFLQSVLASFMVTVIAIAILLISVSPVISSIRQAEKSLINLKADISTISFLPIKNLVERARKNISLERQAALADLIKQVAHDIRSPLSALNIFVGGSKTISSEEKKLIESISKRINDVANNLLLTNTKPEESGTSKEIQVTNLNNLIRDVVTEKTILIEKNLNIQIQSQIPEALIFSKIESSALSRILSNLINNSIESISEVGLIGVSLYMLNNQIMINIQDNGSGMSEETLSKLGTQNFSTKNQSNSSGSGLGFWNAKNIIELAGGTISVQSKLGVGTLVTIAIPA